MGSFWAEHLRVQLWRCCTQTQSAGSSSLRELLLAWRQVYASCRLTICTGSDSPVLYISKAHSSCFP